MIRHAQKQYRDVIEYASVNLDSAGKELYSLMSHAQMQYGSIIGARSR